MNESNVPQSLQFEINQWIGGKSADLAIRNCIEYAANVSIENKYAVSFSDTINRGRGKSPIAGSDSSSETVLKAHTKNDIKQMTDHLLMSVESALKAQSSKSYPILDGTDIARSGQARGINIQCDKCIGTAEVVCPSCGGNLYVHCTASGCQYGKVNCSVCYGTGSVKDICFSCGGRGGSYTTPATWDHQVYNPNNTWEHQQRQAASGGQWVSCSSCHGTGGSQKSCTAYGCSYGKVTCNTCRGKGTVDCVRCAMTGRVVCDKCFAGYNHAYYEPKASIVHTKILIADKDQSAQLQRVCMANRQNIESMAVLDGEAKYTQEGTSIIRIQSFKIPIYIYEIDGAEISDRKLIRSRSADKIDRTLDWGELGDDLLRDNHRAKAVSPGKNPAWSDLDGCLRSPLHCFGVVSLANAIGLATLFPWYKPKKSSLNSKFIEKTLHFVSDKFANNLIANTAREMRRVLLLSHIIALAVAGTLLLGVWLQVQYRMFDISQDKLLSVAHYGITICLFLGTGAFIRRLVKANKYGLSPKFSQNDVVTALVMKSPAHWMCMATYLVLLWWAHQVIAG